MLRRLSRLFSAFWPLGLFAFYVLIVLSFTQIRPEVVAQIFGLSVIICAALAWLVSDFTVVSENRVRTKLRELEDVLAPYEGMKLREMPPEVQAMVRSKLGWDEPPALPIRKS